MQTHVGKRTWKLNNGFKESKFTFFQSWWCWCSGFTWALPRRYLLFTKTRMIVTLDKGFVKTSQILCPKLLKFGRVQVHCQLSLHIKQALVAQAKNFSVPHQRRSFSVLVPQFMCSGNVQWPCAKQRRAEQEWIGEAFQHSMPRPVTRAAQEMPYLS